MAEDATEAYWAPHEPKHMTPPVTWAALRCAGAGPRAQDATEAYWALHERMRRDYLADLEAAYEVYLAAKMQHAPGSPALAHVEKLAGIRPILPRLQVRREQAEQVPLGPRSSGRAA